jgi:hypothetical protein
LVFFAFVERGERKGGGRNSGRVGLIQNDDQRERERGRVERRGRAGEQERESKGEKRKNKEKRIERERRGRER